MSVCSVEHEIHVARHAYHRPYSPLVTVYLSLCIFIAILTAIPTSRCTRQYLHDNLQVQYQLPVISLLMVK